METLYCCIYCSLTQVENHCGLHETHAQPYYAGYFNYTWKPDQGEAVTCTCSLLWVYVGGQRHCRLTRNPLSDLHHHPHRHHWPHHINKPSPSTSLSFSTRSSSLCKHSLSSAPMFFEKWQFWNWQKMSVLEKPCHFLSRVTPMFSWHYISLSTPPKHLTTIWPRLDLRYESV